MSNSNLQGSFTPLVPLCAVGLFLIASLTPKVVLTSALKVPLGKHLGIRIIAQSRRDPGLGNSGPGGLSLSVKAQEPFCKPDNTFEASVEGGRAPYTFFITDPSGRIVAASGQTTSNGRTFVTFPAQELVSYKVTVTDANNNVVTGSAIIPCESYASLTQDNWSRNKPKLNGEKRKKTLAAVFDNFAVVGNQLIVGIKGRRSLTIPSESRLCMLDLLPAVGDPVPLPTNFGDVRLNAVTCSPSVPLVNGKIANALLGNTIALCLNVGWSEQDTGGLDHFLGGVLLCSSMESQAVSAGADGIVGTPDDQLDQSPEAKVSRSIPDSVIRAIAAGSDLEKNDSIKTIPGGIAGAGTIGRLVQLAHLALAGETNLGGATLSEINAAVESVNLLFNRGGVLRGCTGQNERLYAIGKTDDDQMSTLLVVDPVTTQAQLPPVPNDRGFTRLDTMSVPRNSRTIYFSTFNPSGIVAFDTVTQEFGRWYQITDPDPIREVRIHKVGLSKQKLFAVEQGGAPNGIGYSCSVYILDLATGLVQPPIRLPGSECFDGAMSPDGNTFYVPIRDSGTVALVAVIDTVSLQVNVIRTQRGAHDIVLNALGTRAYVTNEFDGSLSCIDLISGGVSTVAGNGASPIPLALSSDERFVYVANRDSRSLSIFKTTDCSLLGTVNNVVPGVRPVGVAFSRVNGRVYVAGEESKALAVYDASGPLLTYLGVINIPVKTASFSGFTSVLVQP